MPTALLDPSQKQNVEYCIPNWLRDEQVKLALARVSKRIEPHPKRPEPIAIVCYGPSLNDTWEKIRDFKIIITCSGAHKFLIDRGIIPTWHTEVDPRAHKTALIGPPHKDVKYLPASCCHPAVFDHLEGFDVALWHVYDPTEEGNRARPPGEWAVTGGCSVGLRAMTIAAFFGFTDLHVFGMDGSEGPSGKHAAAHPNQPPAHSIVNYGGKEYRTTSAYLEAARQTWHELDQMPAVRATFYGEGLVQAMAKDYVPKQPDPRVSNIIAFATPETISSTYRDLNVDLHRTNLGYGVGGGRHADVVTALVATLKTPSPSVLDYGCGKGYLAKALPFPIWEYDPAIPEKSASPRPADLVVCGDVLEHVEPTHLQVVLADLARCTKQIGYFVIHTGKSSKALADGRNSHLIQENEDWWRNKLRFHFSVAKIIPKGMELFVIVGPKPKKAKKAKKAQP